MDAMGVRCGSIPRDEQTTIDTPILGFQQDVEVCCLENLQEKKSVFALSLCASAMLEMAELVSTCKINSVQRRQVQMHTHS